MKIMEKTISMIKRAARWYFNHAVFSDSFCPSDMFTCRYMTINR